MESNRGPSKGFFHRLCCLPESKSPVLGDEKARKEIENLKPPYILSERILPTLKKEDPPHSMNAAIKRLIENIDSILMWKCDTRYIYSILIQCKVTSDPYKNDPIRTADYLMKLREIALSRKFEEQEGGGTIPACWSWIQKAEHAKPSRFQNGENNFFFCMRPHDGQKKRQTHRTYIHLKSRCALDVWEFVVKEIVDKPSQFPLIHGAKTGGPRLIDVRYDNIVIFTSSFEANQLVIDALGRYQDRHPDHFLDEVPLFTQKVRPGVGWGEEPSEEMSQAMGGHSMSFTEVRAHAIAYAISDLQKKGASITESTLRDAVIAKFKQYHIDK